MLRAIAAFEVVNRLRRISTYVYALVFFSAAFLLVIAFGGAFKEASFGLGGGEKVLINSPYSLAVYIGLLSYFGLPVTAAIMGRAAQQDFEYDVYPFFFTSPISKLQYLGGRFLGAFAVMLLIFLSIPIGALLASAMPFLESTRVGPNRLLAYLGPFVIIVVPNLLFTGAVFFGMAALLRKILPVFLTAVLVLLGYLIGARLAGELENKVLASLIDPFGQFALSQITEYWTVFERNARLIPFAGVLLANRLIWAGIGIVVFALAYRRFAFSHLPGRERARGRTTEQSGTAPERPLGIAPASRSFSTPAHLSLFTRWSWLQFVETVKNVYFAVIVAAGVLFMVVVALATNRLYGTTIYPVTYVITESVGGSFTLFFFIIITFYSGELVWRERDTRIAQIVDSSPAPTWILVWSKLGALLLVQLLLCCVVMLCGMAIQTVKGYFHFEPAVYLKQLFVINLARLCLFSVLAITIHVLVNHKYLGHFVLIVYYALTSFAPLMGLEHHLYRYPSTPGARYSDMNGFGHFVAPTLWFDLYWATLAVLLALSSTMFWVRGVDGSWPWRLRMAQMRFTLPNRIAMANAAVLFLVLASFIYYNTNRLNVYRSSYQGGEIQAEYEKRYKSFLQKPQPRVTGVKVSVDIFPSERRVALRGAFDMENKSGQPCTEVLINLPIEMVINKLELAVKGTRIDDAEQGVYRIELGFDPLQPHQKTRLDFDLSYGYKGFANSDSGTELVYNGTFFSSGYLPTIGYREGRELVLDQERKKHGLPPKERLPDLNDPEGRKNNYITEDADWVTFDATVSTSLDQIALAPGYLEREWTEGNRRYFHYTMEGTILKFFSFLSARYQVKRDHWNDVAIEIFYHPGHEYDLDRMINSIKKSLDYYTSNFGPYQHRQVRIVEFPRYQLFAQSFPNTIPYSEGLGFIAKVNDKDENDIDYPFYITAHEVAHQWWAHQVIGGRVQGSTLLSETLSQYSALMVMKAEFGPEKMRRFLKYELDEYLKGRATEQKKELPLMRVENQGYIHYRKGSLVMYALQDYIGEPTLNSALATYLKQVGHQEPPYTNAAELLEAIRRVTPDNLKYVLEDMFETITLFENRAVKAVYRERSDGRFDVTLTASAKKLRHDPLGQAKEVPLHDLIDIGVLDDAGKVLYLQKHWIDREQTEIAMVVDRRPARAGIDPFNKLIDRKPDDNSVRVEKE